MKRILLFFAALLLLGNAYAQPICNASFTWTSLGGLQVQFTNTSSSQTVPPGMSSQYFLRIYGGNTFGVFYNTNVETYTFSSPGTYTVDLINYIVDSSNGGVTTCWDTSAAQTIILTSGSSTCANKTAQFYAQTNGTLAMFSNVSSNATGYTKSHLWDFGDGTTSTATSPQHYYPGVGTYNVKLVTTWSNSQNYCIDSTTQAINITSNISSKIAGQAVLDTTVVMPNSELKVWLIEQDTVGGNLYLNAIDSVILPAPLYWTQHYEFVNVAASTSLPYLVKAAVLNGPTSGTGNIPTYHTSALLWSNAQAIWHQGNISLYNDIIMQTGTVTNGPGFVGGNVAQGANKGTANGINEMTVLLFDNNGNLIKGVLTDAVGDYSFGNLPTGIYKVYPEDAGYNTTPVTINISNNNSSITGINFTRSYSKRTITPAPNSIANLEEELIPAIYPNPAKNNVTIRWNGKLSEQAAISITDVTGKKVIAERVNTNGATNINVSTLQSGMYFITISSEHIQHIQKLTIQ